VNAVTVSADRGEISLSFRAKRVGREDVLASAIELAGFVLDQARTPGLLADSRHRLGGAMHSYRIHT
jgi:hypothetical protein